MHEAAAEPTTSNEMERAFMALEKQDALIQTLYSRLSSVSHRSPTEAPSKPTGSGHIAHIGDIVADHNRSLQNLIEELSI